MGEYDSLGLAVTRQPIPRGRWKARTQADFTLTGSGNTRMLEFTPAPPTMTDPTGGANGDSNTYDGNPQGHGLPATAKSYDTLACEGGQ